MKPRPLITANQVTAARLVPMPLIAWLIYRGEASWWIALVLSTVLALTDYVDGYLARKHGPTVLGGLLDPIADKVFIALVYVPLTDVGFLPWWLVALMFVREFLVTAMRSAYAYRGVTFQTSYLAKVKTWVQMQGVGLMVLLPLTRPRTVTIILAGQVGLAFVAVVAIAIARRKLWRGGGHVVGFVGALLAVHLTCRPHTTLVFALAVITALTWLSGVDYLVGGLRRLRAAAPWNRADGVRVVAAIALPIVAIAALVDTPAPAAPLLAVLALELAVGGLDNLLAHHRDSSGALRWGLRTWGAAALIVACLVAPRLGLVALVAPAAYAAAAVSLVGVIGEFARGRRYYLDDRLREQAA